MSHDHGHHHIAFESEEAVRHAEGEGEVLLGMTERAIGDVARHAHALGLDVRTVLDLGSGPGVGTELLAHAFPDAQVVAVDGSAMMLERAAARAEGIATLRAEFPEGLDTLPTAEVVWASMSIHHIGDETDAFRRIHARLAPGGLLAVVERAGPTRVVPVVDDLGVPGLWDRLDAAWADWFKGMRAGLPGAVESEAYPTMLAAAGFTLVDTETLTLVHEPPHDDDLLAYARTQLERTQHQLAGTADPADLAALDALRAHDDLRVEMSRQFFIARA